MAAQYAINVGGRVGVVPKNIFLAETWVIGIGTSQGLLEEHLHVMETPPSLLLVIIFFIIMVINLTGFWELRLSSSHL